MKTNKKGFTLIELLAVIVILAIVALVATPIIMTTVSNAKKSAAIASANNVITAINYNEQMANFEESSLTGNYSTLVGNDNKITDISSLKISGDKPTAVNLTVTDGVVDSGTIEISKYCVQVEKGKAVDSYTNSGTTYTTTSGTCPAS